VILVTSPLIMATWLAASASVDQQPTTPVPPPPTDRALDQRVDELIAAAPPGQHAIVRDRQVSAAEYQAATGRAVGCLQAELDEEAGSRGVEVEIEVSRPAMTADRFEYRYTYSLRDVSGEGLQALPADLIDVPSAIERLCRAVHVDAVEGVYQLGRLGDGSYITSSEQGLSTCLRRQGETVTGGDVRSWLAAEVASRDAGTPGALAPGVVDCVGQFPSVVAAVEPAK
jgi:hypothetical protein